MRQEPEGYQVVITACLVTAATVLAPLAMYLVIDTNPPAAFDRFTDFVVMDLYAAAKANIVLLYAMLATGAFVCASVYAPLIVSLFMAVFGGLLIASSSPFGELVWQGAPHQAESLSVLIAYLSLMLTASAVMAYERAWKILTVGLGISLALVTFFGAAEAKGYPPHTILPGWLIGLDPTTPITAATHYISSTLGNANHLGMYVAMLGPMMAVLALGKLHPIFHALTLCAGAMVILCKSRLGAVGFIGGTAVGIWLLCRLTRATRNLV